MWQQQLVTIDALEGLLSYLPHPYPREVWAIHLGLLARMKMREKGLFRVSDRDQLRSLLPPVRDIAAEWGVDASTVCRFIRKWTDEQLIHKRKP